MQPCERHLTNTRFEASATSKGFALPLVLWIVAILGVVVAGIATWVQQATSNAIVLSQRSEAQLAIADIRNELVFLIASRPFSVSGLEIGDNLEMPDPSEIDAIMANQYSSNRTIAFDARAYRSETHPNILVRIQDGRGLFNLNDLSPGRIDTLLRLFDVEESTRNRLIDTLRDYIDEDDLSRISGAEARDYTRAGRMPPPNQAMVSPYQAKNIFGWADISQLWLADLASPILGTCQSTGFNPNTAPDLALRANLSRLTADNVRDLIAKRRLRALRNQREMSAAAGITLFEEPFFYSFIPGPCSVIEFEDTISGDRFRYSITFNQSSQTQPWRHDYELRIPRRQSQPPDATIEAEIFPSPESVAAREGLGSVSRRPR